MAGIVAGKNGNYKGTVFSGTAPEAQLVLMKVADAAGFFYDDCALAAFDDASKMEICAVNYSAGDSVILQPLFDTVFEKLKNAGIMMMVAAANSDRAQETTDNPDYTYPSQPAVYSNVTSVASINADVFWDSEYRMTLGNGEVIT